MIAPAFRNPIGALPGAPPVLALWRIPFRTSFAAGHAHALGRNVAAVPGPVTSTASAGCHRLIRDFDATLVTSADEVAASTHVALTSASAPRNASAHQVGHSVSPPLPGVKATPTPPVLAAVPIPHPPHLPSNTSYASFASRCPHTSCSRGPTPGREGTRVAPNPVPKGQKSEVAE